MTTWVKANNRTARTVWCVQKMTSLYCNAACKNRKDNTCVILPYYKIQNLKLYLVSYHDGDILIYCPALWLRQIIEQLEQSGKDFTSLYCNAAFKTLHITILRYPKFHMISILIYRRRFYIDILPSLRCAVY